MEVSNTGVRLGKVTIFDKKESLKALLSSGFKWLIVQNARQNYKWMKWEFVNDV